MAGGDKLVITSPVEVVLEPDGPPFTFGRHSSSDLVIGDGDRSISRHAGTVSWTGSAWEVANTSGSRPLYVIGDSGLRIAVPVGSSSGLGGNARAIQVVGGVYLHEIGISVGGDRRGSATVAAPVDVDETLMPAITPNERIAMVAMIEGYLLDHPRYSPEPRTYAEAADRIGVPVATVRKRIENVRRKLISAGLVELERGDARSALAEFALATEMVSRADLVVLPAPSARP